MIAEETEQAIKHCVELGIADIHALRNYRIKQRYDEMKRDGMGSKESILLLMKSSGLEWSSINEIVYGTYFDRKKVRDFEMLKKFSQFFKGLW